MGHTYVDLSLADIFSFLQRDENEGCEGHIFLLSVPEATLGCGAWRKDGVTSVAPHANQHPCRISESGQG